MFDELKEVKNFNEITGFKILQCKIQWNLPTADTPNSGHAMNNGQNVESPTWQSF